MKIGFVSTDWAVNNWIADGKQGEPELGGAGHYRVGLPAKHLGDGYDVSVGTLVTRDGEIGVHRWSEAFQTPEDSDPSLNEWGFDLIVLQRWMFGDLPEDIRRARANGQLIVNDVDDYFDGLDPRNQAYRATDPRLDPIENRAHYREVVRSSTLVTCSTPFLAEWARGLGAHAVVVDNAIDLNDFQSHESTQYQRGRLPNVGWVGAMPWRSGDVETLDRILPQFAAQSGVHFRHDGHVPGWPTFAAAAGLKDEQVGCGPMRPTSEIGKLYESIDLGLVPLRDIPFNRAKSWIKGLEYAASGIPFVAQDLPEYRRLHRYGIGELASSRGQWMRQLKSLLDPERRARRATEQRYAVETFNIADRINRWRTVYKSLL